jgi:hypothetical protein
MPYDVLNFLNNGGLYGIVGGYLMGVGSVVLVIALSSLFDG